MKGINPAAWRGNLDKLLAAPRKAKRVRNHPALPIERMGAFMVALRAIDGISARCLEFAILTAARSGEARGACWTEVDTDKALWVVPAERMKAKKEHRVPLSPAAVELLNAIERKPGVDLVFPSPRTRGVLSDMALLELMRRQRLGGDTARLPLDVPRLGGRAHELPARAGGGGAGAYQGRCDGSRLLAWRSAGEAAANDGRLGSVRRGAVANAGVQSSRITRRPTGSIHSRIEAERASRIAGRRTGSYLKERGRSISMDRARSHHAASSARASAKPDRSEAHVVTHIQSRFGRLLRPDGELTFEVKPERAESHSRLDRIPRAAQSQRRRSWPASIARSRRTRRQTQVLTLRA